ncbi:Transcriptional regulator WhiB (plasmid) [Streptomyces sp. enrichment culture]
MSTPTRRPSRPAAPEPGTNDWRNHAACRNADPNLFFPIGTTGPALIQTEQAKKVCQSCPVIKTCLTWALTTGQYTGVWGGRSEKERRGLYKNRDTAFLRCLEEQEYIESRLEQGAVLRMVAREVGVSFDVMRRAVRYFKEERQQSAAEAVKAA